MQTTRKQTELTPTHLSDNELIGVRHNQAHLVWEECKPLLAAALEYADGKYSLEHLFAAIEARDMQLWIAYQGDKISCAGITQVVNYPLDTRCIIVFFSGHAKNLESQWETLAGWMKEKNCTSCEIFARKGWIKKLEAIGFEPIHTVLRKKL